MIDKFQKKAIAELPKKFWIIRDSVVEHVLSSTPLHASLVDLQERLAGQYLTGANRLGAVFSGDGMSKKLRYDNF